MISTRKIALAVQYKIPYRRQLSFAAVGICVMAVSYLALIFQISVLGVKPWLAYIIQAILAVELNFVLNHTITWRDRPVNGMSELLKRFWKFNLTRGGLAFVFNSLLFTSLVAIGVNYLIANTVCIGITAVANYFVGDRFVFVQRAGSVYVSDAKFAISMLAYRANTVSVVIPVKQSHRTIRKTVDSLLDQDYPHDVEIVLVGDYRDTTWEPLEDLIREDRVVAIATDIETSGRDCNAKRNIGMAQASGEVIALTDSDMILPPDWISTGMLLVNAGSDCVAGSMRSAHLGFWSRYVDRNQLGSKTPRMGVDYVLDSDNFGLNGLKPPVTANVFVTRKLLDDVGGLDPHFVFTYDDYEWFRRIVDQGHKILCTDQLAAGHYHRQGFPDLIREYTQSGLGCGDYVRKYPHCQFGKLRVKQLAAVCASLVAAVAMVPVCLLFPPVATIALAGVILLSGVSAVRARLVDGIFYPGITFVLGLAFAVGLTRRLLKGSHLPYKTDVLSSESVAIDGVELAAEEVS